MLQDRIAEPGLVTREIIAREGEFVTIREVWDTSIPNCPYLLLSFDPFRLNRDADRVERAFMLQVP